MVELCNRYNVALVCDEIHADFEMPGNHHTSMITLEGAQRAVVCISATKTFNLAGLQASTVVFPNAGSYAAVISPMQFASQPKPAQLFLRADGTVVNTDF